MAYGLDSQCVIGLISPILEHPGSVLKRKSTDSSPKVRFPYPNIVFPYPNIANATAGARMFLESQGKNQLTMSSSELGTSGRCPYLL